jgi:hypothetical protein
MKNYTSVLTSMTQIAKSYHTQANHCEEFDECDWWECSSSRENISDIEELVGNLESSIAIEQKQ